MVRPVAALTRPWTLRCAGTGVLSKASAVAYQTAHPAASPRAEIRYARVLNRVLPPDIRFWGWAPVERDFDARFGALYRRYKYYFCSEGMDLVKMHAAAEKFVGWHDFRNFCKARMVCACCHDGH